jgi:hypothetical protein
MMIVASPQPTRPAGQAAAPVVSATVETCLAGSPEEPGSVTFAGQMMLLAGASEMAIPSICKRARRAEAFSRPHRSRTRGVA